jgi:hypothetical protein
MGITHDIEALSRDIDELRNSESLAGDLLQPNQTVPEATGRLDNLENILKSLLQANRENFR